MTSTHASSVVRRRAGLVAAAALLLVPATAHAERRVVERPASGPPGTVVTLAGSGFRAHHAVTVTTAGRPAVRVRADRRGRFTAVVRLRGRAGRRVDVRASDGRRRTVSRFRVVAAEPAAQTAEAVSEHGPRLRWTPSVVAGPASVRVVAAGLPHRARGRLTWAGRPFRVRTDRHGSFARTVRLTSTTARGRRGSVRVRSRRIAFAVDVATTPGPGPGPGPGPQPGLPPLALPAFDSAGDPVVAAAGDIACAPGDASFNAGLGAANYCRQFWTYRLVAAMAPTAVLGLGDFQYEDGTLGAYQGSYDRSWGRLKGITYPAPGNDHDQSGGGDYLAYWASRLPSSAAYQPYSFDLGTWHLVSLPSNCRDAQHIDCAAGGKLDTWLQKDLAAHAAACTLAFWHNPRWNSPSATHGSTEFRVEPLAQTLHDHGADVLLSGDNHNYERFAPQDGAGAPDPAKGLTQFVVGTGGKVLMPFIGTAPNSVARDDRHFGALRLALHRGSFAWQFLTEAGAVTDSGSQPCH